MTVTVVAHTSSKRSKVVVKSSGEIHVYTQSVPVNGKANKAILLLLSEHFNIPKSQVVLVSGERNKVKLFKVNVV